MVNACRKPGEWQTYDIVFTAPRFDDDGKVKTPAYVTVLHNGVLVQNHFELLGSNVVHRARQVRRSTRDKEPLNLQFHGNPVRFRNIWIRENWSRWWGRSRKRRPNEVSAVEKQKRAPKWCFGARVGLDLQSR